MNSNNTEVINKNDDVKTGDTKRILFFGLFAGLAASVCCAGPLILLMLGISGAWIGNLSALEPFRPFFIIVALVFLGLAYRKIMKKQSCESDAVCATDKGRRTQLLMFWVISFVVLLSISFPWYGALLFE